MKKQLGAREFERARPGVLLPPELGGPRHAAGRRPDPAAQGLLHKVHIEACEAGRCMMRFTMF